MEPISYFMKLTVSMILMVFFFVGTRKEYTNSWMRDYIIEQLLKKNEEYSKFEEGLETLQSEKEGIL